MTEHVMIVDDDKNMCELIQTYLHKQGIPSSWYTSAEDAFYALKNKDFDVVLTDLRMTGTSGIELCEQITESRPDIPVIVMTAFGSLESAVAAIRAGAYDFVTKPIEMDILALTLTRALSYRALQEKIKFLSDSLKRSQRFDEIIGESSPMKKMFGLIERIADSETSVLILGESGTGKDLVARALHQKSRRMKQPFVAINCAALPSQLLESELFGHARGAFTHAQAERKGLFLQANHGTLFLDEICDLPLDLQPKLLRALEQRSVRPVGSNMEIPVDVRIIAATNRNIEASIEEGLFREDLFFRINVIQIEIPALRNRGTDILLIAQQFVEYFAGRSGKPVTSLSKPVIEKFLNYSWPGNVRELKNAIEHAVALTSYDKIGLEDLPERIRSHTRSQTASKMSPSSELISMAEIERRHIIQVLKAVQGNKTVASQVLGFDRKTLHRKIQRYQLETHTNLYD
jgi:DNA-binding NtrC family response regulator